MKMRLPLLLCLAACGHSSSQPDAGVFAGRPGDLGAGSPVIDHSGPNGGVKGTLQTGAVGDSWRPAGCPSTVPVATGVMGAAWGAETYGATDKSPHAVHTSFRFDTSSSFAVIWETDSATQATYVAYGTSPTKLDHFVQGVTFSDPPNTSVPLAYPLLAHEVHVCGLQPNTTYYFAVGGDGWYGNVYPVVTAPPSRGARRDSLRRDGRFERLLLAVCPTRGDGERIRARVHALHRRHDPRRNIPVRLGTVVRRRRADARLRANDDRPREPRSDGHRLFRALCVAWHRGDLQLRLRQRTFRRPQRQPDRRRQRPDDAPGNLPRR